MYIETENVLREVQFRFTGAKGPGDTIGTLRLKSKRTLNNEEVCACFSQKQQNTEAIVHTARLVARITRKSV